MTVRGSGQHRTGQQSPQERFASVVEALLTTTDATREGRGFGSSALKIGGRIFAMLSGERFVVKLPAPRVDALVAAGQGDRFDPRRNGRVMREWLALSPSSGQGWLPLAREAMDFIGGVGGSAGESPHR